MMTFTYRDLRALPTAALGAALLLLPATAYAQSSTISLNEMKIGAPVFGTDGIKVGEVNRIKADSNGRVTELQVTTGGPASLNAEVIAITPDKIAVRETNSIKLSVSASDAKKLPVLDQDQKG